MRTLIRRTWKHLDVVFYLRTTFLVLAVLGILGVTADRASAAAPLRIMSLGDSITAGFTDHPTWSVPFTFGYQGPLYTQLTNAGYNFQFVGTSGEPWNEPFNTGIPTTIQGPDLRPLGQDGHRGYGGASTSNILYGGAVSGSSNYHPNIAAMLNADDPDIVLLMIGTNGIADGMTYIDPLVNQIVTTKPDAQLIVAQIVPRAHYQADLVAYNNYIKNTVVPKYVALGKNVTTVDQYVNLLTNPSNPTSIDASLICPDGAHLRPEANERLGATWFTGIQAVAPIPEPSTLALLVGFGLLLAARTCWRVRRRRSY